MKTFHEESGLCTIRNECLHPQKLVFTTSFEALRIVKNQFLVAPENQLVLDVVDSSLTTVGDVVINLVGNGKRPHPPGSLDSRWIDLIMQFSIRQNSI